MRYLIFILLFVLVLLPVSVSWAGTVVLEDDSKMHGTYIQNQFSGADDNYGSQVQWYFGARFGFAYVMIDYDTTFTESIDSIIVSMRVFGLPFFNGADDSVRFQTAWGNRKFYEDAVTWNNYWDATWGGGGDDSAWTTAGGLGSSDTSGYHNIDDVLHTGENTDVGDILLAKLSGPAASFPPWGDNGYAMIYITAMVGNGYMQFDSEESTTAGNRPFITVYFDGAGGGWQGGPIPVSITQ